MSTEVSRQTDGQVRMGPGTLYGTLQHLLDQAWVEVVDGPDNADQRRRYYRLNGLGRRALEAEVKRMDSLVRAARAVVHRTDSIVARRNETRTAGAFKLTSAGVY